MMQRIPRLDWLLRGPGLIRNAANYSAFIIDNDLHLVRTGRGWQRIGGAYAIFNSLGNVIIERMIATNRKFQQQMDGWDYRSQVPQNAEFSFALDMLTMVGVTKLADSGVTLLKLKFSDGRPRRLTFHVQDVLGLKGQTQSFCQLLQIRARS